MIVSALALARELATSRATRCSIALRATWALAERNDSSSALETSVGGKHNQKRQVEKNLRS